MSSRITKLLSYLAHNHAAYVLFDYLNETAKPNEWTRFSNADACKLLQCADGKARIALNIIDRSGLIDRDGCKVCLRPMAEDAALDDLGKWKVAILKAAGPRLADPLTNQGLLQSEGCILEWLRAEYDLHRDVVPIVKARTNAGEAFAKGNIQTWAFFNDAIRDANAARTGGVNVKNVSRSLRAPYLSKPMRPP